MPAPGKAAFCANSSILGPLRLAGCRARQHGYMAQRHRLHIVDGDSRRRAQLARIAYNLGHHAEVYANLDELAERPPQDGILLVHDSLDGESPGDVVETLAALEQVGVWLPVILADECPTTDQVVEGIKQGALDFIELPCRQERLVVALSRVSQEAETQATMQRRMLVARERIGKLSRREREVLDRLADGHRNNEIARQLGISPRTVEIHRANMMAKLGANHVAEAVRMQIEARLGEGGSPSEQVKVTLAGGCPQKRLGLPRRGLPHLIGQSGDSRKSR